MFGRLLADGFLALALLASLGILFVVDAGLVVWLHGCG
jgi:hypothetical protein